MTLSEIEKRVALVQRAIDEDDDNEVAHSVEDDLHRDVLRAIAEGPDTASAELARAALKTIEIEFTRWHA